MCAKGKCMIKKNMIFIGHEYHLRTKSTRFLIDLFARDYDVDEATYDMEIDRFDIKTGEAKEQYDILVLFQMLVLPTVIKKRFKYKKAAYFPMYDMSLYTNDAFWIEYKDFNIINFSSTLHKRLAGLGLSSYFIQYYPSPMDANIMGSTENAFFWQRIDTLAINKIAPLLSQLDIKNIHLHIASDPGHGEPKPSNDQKETFNFTTSTWFETKEEMLEVINNSAYYVAPRVYEGIGMSFLEAMAMGRCVIAVNHPTMNEYIIDGENGLLYDYESPQIHNPDDVRRIQKNAHESIVKGYAAWERDKHKILEWLDSSVQVNLITANSFNWNRLLAFPKRAIKKLLRKFR